MSKLGEAIFENAIKPGEFAQMIDYFETGVRIDQEKDLFTFIDGQFREFTYTYLEARLVAASIARKLHYSGVNGGDYVLIDLPNCPEFVFVALACAYGGFTMVLIDNSLSDKDKFMRRRKVERLGIRISFTFDVSNTRSLLGDARTLSKDPSEIVRQIMGDAGRDRAIMGEEQDAIDDTVHFAERAAHLFDSSSLALIMFADEEKHSASDSAKHTRGVPLTWEELLSASIAANNYFSTDSPRLWQERLPFNSFSISDSLRLAENQPRAIWQCALLLSTIEGFQTLVRSIILRSPLRIYAPIDPEKLLYDAERSRSMHVVVNDALMQDMLTVEEWRGDELPGVASRLSMYQCVLLSGTFKNPRTVKRAYDLGTRLFIGYGKPQTSGDVAISQVNSNYQGEVEALDGYEMCVIDADEDGLGKLAVKGPGVFKGYIDARTAFTVDRFFITEDKAVMKDSLVIVRDRSQNMFVSAGQNIYPVEIADVFRHLPGISGVHVFGVPDSRCGMLPIAALERSNPELTTKDVEEMTRQWFSGYTVPISVFLFDQLPRTQRGKLDRAGIEAFFSS